MGLVRPPAMERCCFLQFLSSGAKGEFLGEASRVAGRESGLRLNLRGRLFSHQSLASSLGPARCRTTTSARSALPAIKGQSAKNVGWLS